MPSHIKNVVYILNKDTCVHYVSEKNVTHFISVISLSILSYFELVIIWLNAGCPTITITIGQILE